MQMPPGMPKFGQVPIIGRQQPNRQQIETQVQAAVAQLSMGIYAQLANAHIATRDEHQTVDQDRLRQLAKESQVAARCYFEGIGVISQEGDAK